MPASFTAKLKMFCDLVIHAGQEGELEQVETRPLNYYRNLLLSEIRNDFLPCEHTGPDHLPGGPTNPR